MNRRINDRKTTPPALGARKREAAELRRLLGERLAAARRSAGLSQEELAERIGSQGWTVSRYETGRISPSLAMLRNLSRALHTSPDHLLRIQLDPPQPSP